MGEVRSETLDADELALLRAALRQALKPQAETSAWNSLAHAQVLDIALSSKQIALAAAVSEELGRVGAASPWAITRACARTFASAPWFTTIVASGGYVAFADEDADATVAVSEGDDFKLVGRKKNVLHALGAARWIVSAKIDGVAAFFVLMPDTQGCSVQRYDTIDGAETVDIVFENVRVSASARIDGGRGAELCATLSAWLAATWASERVGAMDALLAKTLAYVRERKQFGKALAEFQAVQQRLADMAIACEQARAVAARLAERAIARDGSSVHLQKKLALAARSVWQSAVQLHGGMGMTNDSAIAPLIKRLIAIECSASHTGQLKGRDLAEIHATESFGALQPQPGDVSFRDEVRVFLADALQPDMQKAAQTTVGFVVEPQAGRAWTRKLYERGWVAPGWPKEFGGTGWSVRERYLFQLECERAHAPHSSEMGLRMVGPTLMRFGTAAQRAEYLPRILSGEHIWCQGYSEPGAGSDLASLKTQAVREGDVYVVNGTKIWTTHAHHADMMFALVRTSHEGRRQDGITFLLIDMKSPGISVQPIVGVDGVHDLNSVFFDDVRVPVKQRVGEENAGWTVAKSLLEFERGGGMAAPELRARHEQLPRPTDPLLAERWALLLADIEVLEQMELQAAMGETLAIGATATPSLLKLEVSAVRQRLSELAVDMVGSDGVRWWPHGLPDARAAIVPRYLADRAHSIFGGALEIQKGIIAKTLLDSIS